MRRALGVAVPVLFFVAVGAWVWTFDPDASSPADREIVRANLVSKAPARARRIGAKLDGKVELVAVEQESESAMPGEETRVVLYWRSLAPLRGDYKVFAHLEGPGTSANLDHHPVYGLHPLRAWRPGRLVRDEVWIAFPQDAEPGEHALWVGVFLQEDPYPRLAVDEPGAAEVDAEGRVRAAAWTLR